MNPHTSSLRVVLLVLLLLCGCEVSERRVSAPEAPRLSPPLPTCDAAERAGFVARKALAGAEHAERRMTFAPGEGLKALQQYDLALACFGAAGLEADTVKVEVRRAGLLAELSSSYQMRRLRLEQALRQERPRAAKSEARVLLELLHAQPDHPYVRWLQRIERTGR